MILGQPVTVKPVFGIYIRKEDGQPLSADGETVIASSYWLRRLENGDVIEVVAEIPQTKTKG